MRLKLVSNALTIFSTSSLIFPKSLPFAYIMLNILLKLPYFFIQIRYFSLTKNNKVVTGIIFQTKNLKRFVSDFLAIFDEVVFSGQQFLVRFLDLLS